MSFPRYPEYKDSGVEWLGEVPAHWAIRPLKYITALRSGGTPSKDNLDFWDGATPWASAKDLKRELLEDTEDHITDVAIEVGAAELVPAGAVLVVVRGMILARTFPVSLAAVPMAINQDLKALVPFRDVRSAYLARALQAAAEESTRRIDEAGHGTKALRMDAWTSLPLPVPSLEEQDAITALLDRETAKIDALIAEQERLIELLKEKRQAVISHAVTKGLDPDVPMKDSGVEWLGEVPAHWVVGPVKVFFESLDGRRVPLSAAQRSHRNGEYPYYGASGVIDHVDDYLFDEDLVLVSEDGANLVNRSTSIAFVARGRYWVNNHAHILKPRDTSLVFWAERIEALDLSPFVTGAAQPKLTIDALSNLVIAVPPIAAECADIERFVINEQRRVRSLVDEVERGIALLKERRSALISAAVTGQIDVRDAAAKGIVMEGPDDARSRQDCLKPMPL